MLKNHLDLVSPNPACVVSGARKKSLAGRYWDNQAQLVAVVFHPEQSWTLPMEVDRAPVSQLPSRYGIARSALYTRLKDLKIDPNDRNARCIYENRPSRSSNGRSPQSTLASL